MPVTCPFASYEPTQDASTCEFSLLQHVNFAIYGPEPKNSPESMH